MAELVFLLIEVVLDVLLFQHVGSESHRHAMKIAAGDVIWLLLFFALTTGLIMLLSPAQQ